MGVAHKGFHNFVIVIMEGFTVFPGPDEVRKELLTGQDYGIRIVYEVLFGSFVLTYR